MLYPKFTNDNKSLMKKCLTHKVFDELKTLKTINNFTLNDVINSGVKNSDSSIGAYAGDEESYSVFSSLFDSIIYEYHGFKKEDLHKRNLNIDDLNISEFGDEDSFIVSTRIRVGRNLKDIPLGPAITNKQRQKVEKIVSSTLSSLEGELKGKYYPLNGMSQDIQNQLIKDHFLFKEGDRFLQEAGLNNDWPNNRGIYHNDNKTFLVWVNEEDQLRIISMQKGGNIQEVFFRLINAIDELEKQMSFSYNKHLGYITSCPTNLGTAMRASVHIKLPKLSLNIKKFKSITDEYFLQIRGINGEHSQSEDGIFDISNKRRLGVTEVQCVQDMYDGIKKLIEIEKSL